MLNLIAKVLGVDKLLDYAASGVGAIAGPILAPWKASRDGQARLISAEADASVREINARADANALNIIADAQSEARAYLLPSDSDVRGTLDITREDIAQSIEFQGRKRIANVKSVLEDAADELGDKEVPDHEPDPDWTARFFDCVQDVSSEDMQRVWAKILAGEVESPGRTSLRTLDTLRNMTKTDAEMFRDICDFAIGHDFVFYDDSVKSFSALGYSNLLHLQDCGLINVGPNLVKQFTWRDGKEILLMYHTGAVAITKNQDAKEVLNIPDILLTTAGKELCRYAQRPWHMECLQTFSKFLKSENCQLSYLGGAMPLPDGRVIYMSRTPIEPKLEPVDDPAL